MLRVSIIALLLMAPAPIVIPATAANAQSEGQCEDTPQKKAKRSMFGSILGGITDRVVGRTGINNVTGGLIPVGSIISDELLKLLDCKEQRQAADATTEAIRGGVGTEVRWQSQSRQNVSGASKVTAQEQLADGTNCLTVTDVVIIDGEETTVPKRMCRGRGDSGYRKA